MAAGSHGGIHNHLSLFWLQKAKDLAEKNGLVKNAEALAGPHG
jgi:hypothetical protein